MYTHQKMTSGIRLLALVSLGIAAPGAIAACATASASELGPYTGFYDFYPDDSREASFARAAALGDEVTDPLATASAFSPGCDAYAAPALTSSMQSSRDLLRNTILRLERVRASGLAQGKSSMYVTSALPSYQHAFGSYTRRHDLIVGADHRYNDQWVAGASVGLAHSAIRGESGAGNRIDGTGGSLTAYSAWSPTATSYISAAISLDNMHYSVKDQATNEHARADGLNTGLSLSAGYDAQIGSWTASPYVRLDHITSRVHAFDDAEAVNKGRSSASSLGAQVATQISMNWGVLSPHARLEGTRINGWSLTGDSLQAYRDAAADGVPDHDRIDRHFGQMGVGAAALFQGGLTVFGDLDKTFGQQGVTSWRFTLGLRGEL
jgi:uncharacterized protein YhjY with autotransporter beta-barrel domain